jgi:hypothetical protein
MKVSRVRDLPASSRIAGELAHKTVEIVSAWS